MDSFIRDDGNLFTINNKWNNKKKMFLLLISIITCIIIIFSGWICCCREVKSDMKISINTLKKHMEKFWDIYKKARKATNEDVENRMKYIENTLKEYNLIPKRKEYIYDIDFDIIDRDIKINNKEIRYSNDYFILKYSGSGNISKIPFRLEKQQIGDVNISGQLIIINLSLVGDLYRFINAVQKKGGKGILFETRYPSYFNAALSCSKINKSTNIPLILIRRLKDDQMNKKIDMDITTVKGDIVKENIICEIRNDSSDEKICIYTSIEPFKGYPGMNGNAGGSSVLLEIAKLSNDINANIDICFISGSDLTKSIPSYLRREINNNKEDHKDIRLFMYVNQLASTNYAYFFETPIKDIEKEKYFNNLKADKDLFELYIYDRRGILKEFEQYNIDFISLHTGYRDLKTREQHIKFGGVKNMEFDQGYNTMNDNISNVNYKILEKMANIHIDFIYSYINK